MKNKLYYSAAFYPELWNRDVFEEDIRYMKKTGINAVRMAEFAWAYMEPEQDRIDLSFFVKCIEKLYENGIETIICTPTAAPPIWISHNHPERMHVNEKGETMIHGARQHVCTNNSFMRERSGIIIEQMAKTLGNLPGVIAWQTDNEFKCHVAECYCSSCKSLWHKWLEKRYGKIENLNESWGTNVWSEKYLEFEQVPQPFNTTFLHNSSLSTMYRLFSRDMVSQFQQNQLDIIREYSDAPITHNTALFFNISQEKTFENLDFFSFDTYELSENYKKILMMCDFARGANKWKNFWIMETSPSHNGCLTRANRTHPDGFLLAECTAAYALGAQGISYWLWRGQRSGCEQTHGSILSPWGKPAIGYDNVIKTSNAIKDFENSFLSTTVCDPNVALTYSDTANVYFKTEPYKNLDYIDLFQKYYRYLYDADIFRDIVFEGSEVKNYKVVCSPFMPYISDEYTQKMENFVHGGGTWIVGPMSGTRTCEHTAHTDCGLGNIEKLAGVETLFTFSLSGTGAVGEAFGTKAPLGHMSALFSCKESVPVGKVFGKFANKEVFMTERSLGKGKIVLIGASPLGAKGEYMMQSILKYYCNFENEADAFNASPGIVKIIRIGAGFKLLVAVNMENDPNNLYIPFECIDHIKNENVSRGVCSIPPFGYKILKFDIASR